MTNTSGRKTAARLLRSSLRRFATVAFALALFYFVISICISLMKLTGWLTDGPMYFDFQTPSHGDLFLFQVVGLMVLLALAWVRRKL